MTRLQFAFLFPENSNSNLSFLFVIDVIVKNGSVKCLFRSFRFRVFRRLMFFILQLLSALTWIL